MFLNTGSGGIDIFEVKLTFEMVTARGHIIYIYIYYYYYPGHKSKFQRTIDTPKLALTGQLWGVYCEDFWENLPCYNGTALYLYLAVFETLRFPVHTIIACPHVEVCDEVDSTSPGSTLHMDSIDPVAIPQINL